MRQIANRIIEIKDNKDHLILKTDGPIFKVLFLTEDIVRIRCSFDKTFAPEASYILVMTAWEDKFDHLFEGERKKVTPVAYQLEESDRQLILSTNKIKLVIHKIRFGIDIYDNKGQLVHSDIREKAYSKDRLGRIYHYSRISDKSYYYGFGEKTGEINKFRRVLKMSNRDTPSYDPVVTDPLYKHIPFYITFDESTKTYRGLFYHNTYDSVFDMGCDRSGYWNKYCYYSADGGEIDLFFIYGPSIKEVVRKYTDLTGKTAMPPLYSLGYLGSTMYYTELDEKSDQAILGFAEKAKKERINCDGFFLSSGYTSGEDGKRYVFNWNYKKFDNPSCNNDNTVTEPWMYPNYTEYVRKAINLRYTLIPYLYSLMYQAATFGDPIMRPLFYEFDDPEVYEESFNFMLGDYLLIANVLDKGQKRKRYICLRGQTGIIGIIIRSIREDRPLR
ncbi:TIM-barrel domain-containing protein [Petroclostridium xylanilyticum]|uniref:TIM-barrel domain-containing protein n=1 Tax=Petroclostridium xylanilyticum TaxID=1792311 RepID=UPI001FA82710|nr:TIM-barrel domain-containing protein [Petroclostridium xylanilyticum]